MIVGQIKDGIVLDHITAGRGMEIYNILGLGELDCTVAMIKNADSPKMGKKDIIKIDDANFDIDLDALGYLDPGSTVNIIREGKIIEKHHPALPEKLVNVIHCKNPRCITSVEPGLDQVFLLTKAEERLYRCAYCETERK